MGGIDDTRRAAAAEHALSAADKYLACISGAVSYRIALVSLDTVALNGFGPVARRSFVARHPISAKGIAPPGGTALVIVH
jgi:hypothetical protein